MSEKWGQMALEREREGETEREEVEGGETEKEGERLQRQPWPAARVHSPGGRAALGRGSREGGSSQAGTLAN